MTLRLTIRTGKEPGKSIELSGDQLTIGRDEGCDLTLRDDKVSRKHAILEAGSDGKAVLRDLDSSNGTYVNGQPIRTVTITGGEHLRFGDTVVVASEDGRGAGEGKPGALREAAVAATRLGAPTPPAAAAPAGDRAGSPPEPQPAAARSLQAPPSPSTIQRIKLQRSLLRTTIVGVVVAVALIVVVVLLATGALSSSQAPPATAAQVISQVAPSTVLVVSDHGNGTGERGSGWVWDASRGLIVTNAHVTAGGVLYTIGSGQTMTLQTDAQGEVVAGAHARVAKLLGQALCEDIAVLKVSNTGGLRTLPRLPSQSELKIGDGVVAVGYPGTVSLLQNPQFGANLTGDTGVVSQPRTTFPAIPGTFGGPPTTGPYHDVILTDTPINHGNSGGPLVDYHARLVGMNTATNQQAQGQNYAIGVDRIDQIVPRLLAGQNVCQ